MQSINAVSGILPKEIGKTSTVQVLGTELETGMLVTIVSANTKSQLKVWVGTVKSKNAKGYWSVDIEALCESKPIDLNEVRIAVASPSDKLKSVEDTQELKKPLPVPPPPPVPPGGLMYVKAALIKGN